MGSESRPRVIVEVSSISSPFITVRYWDAILRSGAKVFMFIGTVFPPVLVKNHIMPSLRPAEPGACAIHCRANMDAPLKGLHWTEETGSLIYQISHAGK